MLMTNPILSDLWEKSRIALKAQLEQRPASREQSLPRLVVGVLEAAGKELPQERMKRQRPSRRKLLFWAAGQTVSGRELSSITVAAMRHLRCVKTVSKP